MTSDFIDPNQKARGGLAAFYTLKDDVRVASSDGDGPWAETWKARKGRDGKMSWPYSLKPGQQGQVILLTDLHMRLGYKLVTGWNDFEGNSYAKTDWVVDPVWDISQGSMDATGRPDIMGKVLGREPRKFAVATVLDLLPWTNNKTGETQPYSIRPLVVDNEAVLATLAQVSALQNKGTLQYAIFQVARSNSKTSARIGDVWTFAKFTTQDTILSNERLSSLTPADFTNLDLNLAYGSPDDDTITRMLSMHARIVEKHPGQGARNHQVNDHMLAQAKAGNWSAFTDAGDIFPEPADFGGDMPEEVPPSSSLADLDMDLTEDDVDPFSKDIGL